MLSCVDGRGRAGHISERVGETARDAGSGTGLYTRRLAALGMVVTGVDRNPEMLAAAHRKAPSAELLEADVNALPFADGSFDLSLAVTLLCIVPDPQRAVAELARVTKPGGRVVPAEFNPISLWAAWRRITGWRVPRPVERRPLLPAARARRATRGRRCAQRSD